MTIPISTTEAAVTIPSHFERIDLDELERGVRKTVAASDSVRGRKATARYTHQGGGGGGSAGGRTARKMKSEALSQPSNPEPVAYLQTVDDVPAYLDALREPAPVAESERIDISKGRLAGRRALASIDAERPILVGSTWKLDVVTDERACEVQSVNDRSVFIVCRDYGDRRVWPLDTFRRSFDWVSNPAKEE